MRRKTTLRFGTLFVTLLAWPGVAGAQYWLPAPPPPAPYKPFKPGSVALQLTDGSIMVQEYASANWWKLTPDEHANYDTGTWSPLSSSVAFDADNNRVPYAPRLFASAVLPDGRVIVEGGEYEYTSTPHKSRTNKGSIFNPTEGPGGTWTPVNPPPGWQNIGDAPSVVLPDGTFMLGRIGGTQLALLDTTTTPVSWIPVNGVGKCDRNSEEGWTLLPPLPGQSAIDGAVLTIDTYQGKGYNGSACTLPNNSEIYNFGHPINVRIDPDIGTWSTAGNTFQPLSNVPCSGNTGEIGPAVLLPDGTVFATGVSYCNGKPAHTALYDVYHQYWRAGPDIPCVGEGSAKVCNDMADAPAALLITGNVLVQTSPGSSKGNSTFYEYNMASNTFGPPVEPPPHDFTQSNSEVGRMLVVSSGHVFYMRAGEPGEMWFYVPLGTYNPVWAPIITDVTDNGLCSGCLNQGGTYTVSGVQLNGLSQGAAYGDDSQSASNYPLVLIENCNSNKKTFARTHDFSTMGVATGFNNTVTAQFTIAPGTDTGFSKLIVIANGIPSQPATLPGTQSGGSGCIFNVVKTGN
jgi:hypothetical protein